MPVSTWVCALLFGWCCKFWLLLVYLDFFESLRPALVLLPLGGWTGRSAVVSFALLLSAPGGAESIVVCLLVLAPSSKLLAHATRRIPGGE